LNKMVESRIVSIINFIKERNSSKIWTRKEVRRRMTYYKWIKKREAVISGLKVYGGEEINDDMYVMTRVERKEREKSWSRDDFIGLVTVDKYIYVETIKGWKDESGNRWCSEKEFERHI